VRAQVAPGLGECPKSGRITISAAANSGYLKIKGFCQNQSSL
jgi:hypothetical protein